MPPLNHRQLSIGERVQHAHLVVDRLEKTHENGDPFAVLMLGNASATSMSSPSVSVSGQTARTGRVVEATGQVGLYAKTGKRQLQLTGPLRVLSVEQVDFQAFLPRIAGDATSSGTGRQAPGGGLDTGHTASGRPLQCR